jgi:hypothetical protein
MTGDDGENNVIPFRAKRQTTPQEIGEAIGEAIIRACECDPRAKSLLRNIALAWQAAGVAGPTAPPLTETKRGAAHAKCTKVIAALPAVSSEPSRRSPRQSRNVE